jgi:predicted ATP-dependent serine protease
MGKRGAFSSSRHSWPRRKRLERRGSRRVHRFGSPWRPGLVSVPVKSSVKKAGPASRSDSPYRTLAEILKDPKILEPPEAVVPRLAWHGRVTLLAAREKDGKSTLAGAAAAAVTRGAEFLDGVALHGIVVLAGLEEHIGDIASRFVDFGADSSMVHIATRIESDPVEELSEAVGRIRPALVIVDTLSAIAEGKLDDGSAKAWQPLMAALTKLARDFNCAVIIVHHARKSDGTYRDSSAIGANVDCIMEMHPDERDTNARHLKVKARFTVPNCTIRFNGTGYEMAETVEPTVMLRNSILEYVKAHPGSSLGKLRDGVVGASAKVGSMVDELVSEGDLREEKGERGARLFYPAATLAQPVPPPVPSTSTRGMS